MTDTMSDAFNLPKLSEALKTIADENKTVDEFEQISQALEDTARLEKALSTEVSPEHHDAEMDEISNEALDSYKKMVNLGFNIDVKYAGSIFEPAVNMLKIAMDARDSKIDKKLKLMRLKLDQEKMERQTGKDDQTIEDNAIWADRNELLKVLRKTK